MWRRSAGSSRVKVRRFKVVVDGVPQMRTSGIVHEASAEIDGGKKLRVVKAPSGFPETINILGQVWRVKYVSNLLEERGNFGECVNRKRLLMIDSTQAKESMVDTLWHEALHAGLSMVPVTGLSHELNEEVVKVLTPTVLNVLRTNAKWW